MHRFPIPRPPVLRSVQSHYARVVKLVDTRDLKSLGGEVRLAGSIPAPGTKKSLFYLHRHPKSLAFSLEKLGG